jgi:hypothetical protein
MPILERLQNHFLSYVWRHVLSMLVGLTLLKEAKTLTALTCHESLPTLSRTLNVYEWPFGGAERGERLAGSAEPIDHKFFMKPS